MKDKTRQLKFANKTIDESVLCSRKKKRKRKKRCNG